MEKLIKILVIALVILSGCKTSRKLTESAEFKSSVNTEENRSIKERDALKIENDIASDEETTTEETRTDFYPPDSKSTEKPDSSSAKKADVSEHGAIKSITTTKTTTKKKAIDKSKVAATNEKQEDTSLKKEGETEARSQKTEVKKTGISNLKIIGGVILVLLAVYFLVRKNIIRIPFLSKTVERIRRLFKPIGTPNA